MTGYHGFPWPGQSVTDLLTPLYPVWLGPLFHSLILPTYESCRCRVTKGQSSANLIETLPRSLLTEAKALDDPPVQVVTSVC
jgi:hypothetical protein